MGKKDLTEKDIQSLDSLKKEIIRLGLEDNPSRTAIQKSYDRSKMKSPNSYTYRFGSWKNVLELIDLKSAYEEKVKQGRASVLKGQRQTIKWADMTKEEIMDLAIKEIREKDITSVHEYREKRDREKAPSATSVYSFVGSWQKVMDEYKKRYGD